jgi:hypothetical protein
VDLPFLKMVVFHGELLNNQMVVAWLECCNGVAPDCGLLQKRFQWLYLGIIPMAESLKILKLMIFDCSESSSKIFGWLFHVFCQTRF